MKLSSKQLAIIAILLSAIIGGGTPVTTKIALREMPSFSFTFFRFVIAAITILPIFLKEKPKFHKDIYKVILFSLFMTVNVIFFPLGVHLTTATIASTLYIFGPIIVAILFYFFIKETFNKKKIVGIIFSLIGALTIILLPEISKGTAFVGSLSGNLFITIAVVATALYTVFSKRFQKEYTPIQLTSIFIFTSCIVLVPLAGFDLITTPHWWKDVTGSAIFTTLYTGLLGTTVWYLLYQYAIKHGSPFIAATVLYLQPITTFLFAFTFLGEQLTSEFLFGALLAFVGVYLSINTKKQKV